MDALKGALSGSGERVLIVEQQHSQKYNSRWACRIEGVQKTKAKSDLKINPDSFSTVYFKISFKQYYLSKSTCLLSVLYIASLFTVPWLASRKYSGRG